MATIDNVTIREATKDDMPQVKLLIDALVDFEHSLSGVHVETTITVEELVRDGFDSNPPYFWVMVAVQDNQVVGFALLNNAYASWYGRALFLEDFYVKPEFRGLNLGQRMFKRICQLSVERGITRIDGQLLVGNVAARRFFDRFGAYDVCGKENRLAYRIDEKDIKKTATM